MKELGRRLVQTHSDMLMHAQEADRQGLEPLATRLLALAAEFRLQIEPWVRALEKGQVCTCPKGFTDPLCLLHGRG